MQVVRPSQLPFSWKASEALEVEHALLWMLTFQDNHGHLLGEHGPTLHSVLCTYLGRWGALSLATGWPQPPGVAALLL